MFNSSEEICDDIFQELINFVRDAQWAINGVYEECVERMKNNVLGDLENYVFDNEWLVGLDEELEEMPETCFSCKIAFHFHDGMCRCCVESPDSNQHYDDYCCDKYDAVDETTFLDRTIWKEFDGINKEKF